MENLLTVLKTLGKKMTGVDITGNNLVAVVDNIADNYAESGTNGNNSVLIVNTVGQQSGSQSDGTYNYDVAFSDVAEAIKAGKHVIFREWWGDNYCLEYSIATMARSDGEPAMLTFASPDPNNPSTINKIVIGASSTTAAKKTISA